MARARVLAAGVWSVWACLMTAACRGPTPAIMLSPIGHGGPKHARGFKHPPAQLGAPWRANGLSAPSDQRCWASAQSRSIACTVPSRWDAYGAALAEADLIQNQP